MVSFNLITFAKHFSEFASESNRQTFIMNIHEYQGKEILAKYDLLKTTQDPEKRDKLDEEICYSLGKSKQPFNFAVESKRKVAELIIDTKTKCVVMLSSVFYVVGVMLGIVYILLFVLSIILYIFASL